MPAQGYILGYHVGNVLEPFPNIAPNSSRKVQTSSVEPVGIADVRSCRRGRTARIGNLNRPLAPAPVERAFSGPPRTPTDETSLHWHHAHPYFGDGHHAAFFRSTYIL